MPGKVLPFVSNISTSYVSVTKYIVHKYRAGMSYIPVTTELNLRLNNKPLHLPVDKDHGLLVTTLKCICAFLSTYSSTGGINIFLHR